LRKSLFGPLMGHSTKTLYMLLVSYVVHMLQKPFPHSAHLDSEMGGFVDWDVVDSPLEVL
jgi:hypothetical protein